MVKVHVRNVMKKWKAKNRTDVAIRAQTTFGAGVCALAA
jgi:DNA-binding NarL/FixJ family response regulator